MSILRHWMMDPISDAQSIMHSEMHNLIYLRMTPLLIYLAIQFCIFCYSLKEIRSRHFINNKGRRSARPMLELVKHF